jgi:SNF2 family DNA or RNA helicase
MTKSQPTFSSLLEKLRRSPIVERRARTAPVQEIFYQLFFDGDRAYCRVVDAKGHDTRTDYRAYTGLNRTILHLMESIQSQNRFRIDWRFDEWGEENFGTVATDEDGDGDGDDYDNDNTDDRIELAENELLFAHLKSAPNLVSSAMKPILPVPKEGVEPAKILLEIHPTTAATTTATTTATATATTATTTVFPFDAAPVLVFDATELRQFRLLTDHAVLAETNDGSIIVEIEALGEGFRLLERFRTQLLPQDVEKYLSLLVSYLPALPIRFGEYSSVEGDAVETASALVFEKVDEDNSLYLRVRTVLSNDNAIDGQFLEDFDLVRTATLNDFEQTIIVREIRRTSSYALVSEVSSLLEKHAKRLASRPAPSQNDTATSNAATPNIATPKRFSAKDAFTLEDTTFIINEELAREFVRQELPNLLTRVMVLGADKLKSYNVRAVQPQLSVSLSHGIDFLEGSAELQIEGESFSLFDALTQYRKHSYITLSDGTQALVSESYIARLERLFSKQKNGVKLSFFDLPLIEDLIEDNLAKQTFNASREIFRGFNTLDSSTVPIPVLNATLRPYQEQGFKWLQYLYTQRLGGCLADDMGLGKTLQAIALLSFMYDTKAQDGNSGKRGTTKKRAGAQKNGTVEAVPNLPSTPASTLIVMPKSLLFNWSAELTRFNPNLTFYTYYAETRDLAAALTHNIILTTYAMVRNDIEEFKDVEFHAVILDEAQNIKNAASQTAKAALLLNARHRFALSGTPIENNLGELYSLFRFLNPTMFGSFDDFTVRYLLPIQRDNNKEAIRDLRKKLYPFVLRRLKKDVLKELPDKVEQTMYVEMSPEQARLYESRRRMYQDSIGENVRKNGIAKSQFLLIQAMSELRQIASIPEAQTDGVIISPKRELLMEQALDAIANGHKTLIFANFLMAVEVIAEEFEKAGIFALTMTGATRDRKSIVERFQRDPQCKALIMTLKTGGLGLNLTEADTVFIFDPWWNTAAEMQAVDRAHRMGQDKTVFAYKLITRGTIEEKILLLQDKKRELFDAVISSDTASLKSLSEEDIAFILG